MIRWLFLIVPIAGFSQSFAPEPGAVGSTAIVMDSSIIIDWAANVSVTRGPMDITDPGSGYVTYGTEQDAVGPADGNSIVSLGDGGVAVLTFDAPITDGLGYDFVVFENGFIDHYMELAFVEVSSDGVNYVRFDAVSEIQTSTQLSNFDTVNCRYVHNFAGKYRVGFGTPFDLQELSGLPGLNINAITHVKLIDVVGTIDQTFGTIDSQGTIVNDPYPTPFESGGFDLDAVGVIHSLDAGLQNVEIDVSVYPNPVENELYIIAPSEVEVSIFNSLGQEIIHMIKPELLLLSGIPDGIYFLHIQMGDSLVVKQFIKR